MEDDLFAGITVPTDFSTATDADLNALETQARTAAAPLIPKAKGEVEGEELTDEERAGLAKLSEVVTSVRDERQRRIAEASTAAVASRATQQAVEVFSTEAPTEPATVTAAARPRVADVARAGGGVARVPNVVDGDGNVSTARLVAAPNLSHTNAGHEFANISEVGVAMERAFAAQPRGAGNAYVRTPVVYLERNFDAGLRIGANATAEDMARVMDYAADVNRLPGGQDSLVAAAGWCAPSQIDYGLFELETDAGLLDLPEIQISRGGLQFTTGPDFSSIWGGAGFFHKTEAEVIAASAKTCMPIPCPTFTDIRLQVEGVCITGAFLQDRGYPEMVSRFVRGAMTAHVHKMNVFKINQVIAGSTLFDYTNVANLPVTTSEYKDLSTISRILAVMGIQAVDYRSKYRMGPNAMLEAVAPYWLVESVRADVQRRTGTTAAEAFSVAFSQINSWFNVRNIRVQWVYDWLDAYNTTNTSTVGQTAGVYTLPTTVELLLFAAGTWVAGVADVVRLDSVYDSANLVLNQYTQLFSEEGILVAKRGFESRRIRMTISPSGVTSATADMRTG